MDISDDLQPWRSRISDGAKSIQDVISEDRRHSVRNIANITGLSLAMCMIVSLHTRNEQGLCPIGSPYANQRRKYMR